MKKSLVFILSVVTILALMVPVVYAQEPDPGPGTSFGAVMNVAEGELATFHQDFYDTDGNIDAYRDAVDVAYGSSMGLTSNNVPAAPLSTDLPAGWVGSSIVSSSAEAAAVVFVNYIGTGGSGLGADDISSADYLGVGSPGSDNFCPSVGKRPAEATSIVVMNTTDAAISDVSISFTDRSGAAAGTAMTGITIPAHAQVTHSLYETAFALPDNFLGAARVQSTGGSDLAVVAITHWGAGSTAFGSFGVNCQSTAAAAPVLYAPKVQRRNFAGAPKGQWTDSTGIVVVNTEGTDATARVEFYDRAGSFGGVFTDTIAAYSARGYNTEYGGSANQIPGAMDVITGLIGTGTTDAPVWQGSVVVRSVTGQALVGIAKQGAEAQQYAAGYNMLTDNDAANSWFFPLVYRRGFGGGTNWNDYIGIICQNVSAMDVNPAVTFVDRRATATKCTDSTTTCSFTDDVALGQYVSHGYNTRYNADTPGGGAWYGDPASGGIGNTLDANFIGAAFITADYPIACVQETWTVKVQDNAGVWHNGGDSNLNNVYGK